MPARGRRALLAAAATGHVRVDVDDAALHELEHGN
jgi:hypothetical protein